MGRPPHTILLPVIRSKALSRVSDFLFRFRRPFVIAYVVFFEAGAPAKTWKLLFVIAISKIIAQEPFVLKGTHILSIIVQRGTIEAVLA